MPPLSSSACAQRSGAGAELRMAKRQMPLLQKTNPRHAAGRAIAASSLDCLIHLLASSAGGGRAIPVHRLANTVDRLRGAVYI